MIERGYTHSHRACKDRWKKLEKKFRTVKRKTVKSGQGARRADVEFVKQFGPHFNPRSEKSDPSFLRETAQPKGAAPEVKVVRIGVSDDSGDDLGAAPPLERGRKGPLEVIEPMSVSDKYAAQMFGQKITQLMGKAQGGNKSFTTSGSGLAKSCPSIRTFYDREKDVVQVRTRGPESLADFRSQRKRQVEPSGEQDNRPNKRTKDDTTNTEVLPRTNLTGQMQKKVFKPPLHSNALASAKNSDENKQKKPRCKGRKQRSAVEESRLEPCVTRSKSRGVSLGRARKPSEVRALDDRQREIEELVRWSAKLESAFCAQKWTKSPGSELNGPSPQTVYREHTPLPVETVDGSGTIEGEQPETTQQNDTFGPFQSHSPLNKSPNAVGGDQIPSADILYGPSFPSQPPVDESVASATRDGLYSATTADPFIPNGSPIPSPIRPSAGKSADQSSASEDIGSPAAVSLEPSVVEQTEEEVDSVINTSSRLSDGGLFGPLDQGRNVAQEDNDNSGGVRIGQPGSLPEGQETDEVPITSGGEDTIAEEQMGDAKAFKAHKLPKFEWKKTGFKRLIKKGSVVGVQRKLLYTTEETPHIKPTDLIPVVVVERRRDRGVTLLTLDFEMFHAFEIDDIKGLLNQDLRDFGQLFYAKDSMQEPVPIGGKVYVRENGLEKCVRLNRRCQSFVRSLVYEVVLVFGECAFLARVSPAGKILSILPRRSNQFVAVESRPTTPRIIPKMAEAAFRTPRLERHVRFAEPETRTNHSSEDGGPERPVTNSGQQLIDDRIRSVTDLFDAVVLNDQYPYFCVMNCKSDEFGPVFEGPDALRRTISDLPTKNLSNIKFVRPGVEVADGADGKIIQRGSTVKLVRRGFGNETATALSVANGYLLLRRTSRGLAGDYLVTRALHCIEMDSGTRLVKVALYNCGYLVAEDNYQELRNAAKMRRYLDSEPLEMRAEPNRGGAGHNPNDSLDSFEGEENVEYVPPEESSDDSFAAQEEAEQEVEHRPIIHDEANMTEAAKAQLFAKEMANKLLPGIKDMMSRMWRDKRDQAVQMHSRAQMAATLQIQASLKVFVEERRSENARIERMHNDFLRLATLRNRASFSLLKQIRRRGLGVPSHTSDKHRPQIAGSASNIRPSNMEHNHSDHPDIEEHNSSDLIGRNANESERATVPTSVGPANFPSIFADTQPLANNPSEQSVHLVEHAGGDSSPNDLRGASQFLERTEPTSGPVDRDSVPQTLGTAAASGRGDGATGADGLPIGTNQTAEPSSDRVTEKVRFEFVQLYHSDGCAPKRRERVVVGTEDWQRFSSRSE